MFPFRPPPMGGPGPPRYFGPPRGPPGPPGPPRFYGPPGGPRGPPFMRPPMGRAFPPRPPPYMGWYPPHPYMPPRGPPRPYMPAPGRPPPPYGPPAPVRPPQQPLIAEPPISETTTAQPRVLLPTPPVEHSKPLLEAPPPLNGGFDPKAKPNAELLPKDETEGHKLNMLAVQAAAYKSSNVGQLFMAAATMQPKQPSNQQPQQPELSQDVTSSAAVQPAMDIPLPTADSAPAAPSPSKTRIDPERINEELLKGTLESLDSLRKEEEEFEKSTSEWLRNYEAWLDSNRDHPNQEQFKQYQDQCKTYKQRMEKKKASILQRKTKLLDILDNRNRLINAPTRSDDFKQTTTNGDNSKSIKRSEKKETTKSPPRKRSPVERSVDKEERRSSQRRRSSSDSPDDRNSSRDRRVSPRESSRRRSRRSRSPVRRRDSPDRSERSRGYDRDVDDHRGSRRHFQSDSPNSFDRGYDRERGYERDYDRDYNRDYDRRYDRSYDSRKGFDYRDRGDPRADDFSRDVDLRYHELDAARPPHARGDIDHRRMENPFIRQPAAAASTVQSFEYGHQSRLLAPTTPAAAGAPQVIDYGHGRASATPAYSYAQAYPPRSTARAPPARGPPGRGPPARVAPLPYNPPAPEPTPVLPAAQPIHIQPPAAPPAAQSSAFPPSHRPASPFRSEMLQMGANPPPPATSLFPSAQASGGSLFPAAQHPTMQPATTRAPPEPSFESQVVPIDDLLYKPAREDRPERLLVVVRGLPGVGKSHLCRMIREKEQENGGAAPRILSLDDYFEGDEEDYDIKMEEAYREQLLRSFKRQVDDGFFPFIILDSVNARVKDFMPFYDYAKKRGFQIYVTDLRKDLSVCLKRNIHKRTAEDLDRLQRQWEPAPKWMTVLDVSSLLQEADIQDVEMEDVAEEEKEEADDDSQREEEEEEAEEGMFGFLRSKWDQEAKEEKMERLDGLRKIGSLQKRSMSPENIAEYLELDLDSGLRDDGRRHVRWADLEEMKAQRKRKRLGFVVGQTDWNKLLSDDSEVADQALNRTKYF